MKLKLSANSAALGAYLLDVVNTTHFVAKSEYYLYAVASLFVAAKTIELDRRIPFIKKLRRAADQRLKAKQVKTAEIKVLEACSWNPLYGTLLDMLEYFMSQGVVFSSDEIEGTVLIEYSNPHVASPGVLKERNPNT